MNPRHLLGTALFLALSVALVLFLTRDRAAPERPADSAPPREQARASLPSTPESPDDDQAATPARIPTASPRVPVESFSTTMISFDLSESDPAEAFEALGRQIGYQVSFTDTAWEAFEGASLHLHLEDVSVTTALTMLRAVVDCTWKAQDDVLWILLPGEEPPQPVR